MYYLISYPLYKVPTDQETLSLSEMYSQLNKPIRYQYFYLKSVYNVQRAILELLGIKLSPYQINEQVIKGKTKKVDSLLRFLKIEAVSPSIDLSRINISYDHPHDSLIESTHHIPMDKPKQTEKPKVEIDFYDRKNTLRKQLLAHLAALDDE